MTASRRPVDALAGRIGALRPPLSLSGSASAWPAFRVSRAAVHGASPSAVGGGTAAPSLGGLDRRAHSPLPPLPPYPPVPPFPPFSPPIPLPPIIACAAARTAPASGAGHAWLGFLGVRESPPSRSSPAAPAPQAAGRGVFLAATPFLVPAGGFCFLASALTGQSEPMPRAFIMSDLGSRAVDTSATRVALALRGG